MGGLLDVAQNLTHLSGGLLGLVGQGLHLGGHHGEASAVLAGAAGLDGGVERQHVRLLGDVVDGVDDVANGLGLLGQREDARGDGLHLLAHHGHGAHGFIHRPPAALAQLLGLARRLAHRARAAGGLLGRLGNLLHGAHRLGHRAALLLGAGHLLAGAGEDLRVGARQLVDELRHGAQGLLALGGLLGNLGLGLLAALGHAVEGPGQLARLVVVVDFNAVGEVAAAQLLHAGHEALQRVGDAAGEQEAGQEDGHHTEDGAQPHAQPHQPGHVRGVLLGGLPHVMLLLEDFIRDAADLLHDGDAGAASHELHGGVAALRLADASPLGQGVHARGDLPGQGGEPARADLGGAGGSLQLTDGGLGLGGRVLVAAQEVLVAGDEVVALEGLGVHQGGDELAGVLDGGLAAHQLLGGAREHGHAVQGHGRDDHQHQQGQPEAGCDLPSEAHMLPSSKMSNTRRLSLSKASASSRMRPSRSMPDTRPWA